MVIIFEPGKKCSNLLAHILYTDRTLLRLSKNINGITYGMFILREPGVHFSWEVMQTKPVLSKLRYNFIETLNIDICRCNVQNIFVLLGAQSMFSVVVWHLQKCLLLWFNSCVLRAVQNGSDPITLSGVQRPQVFWIHNCATRCSVYFLSFFPTLVYAPTQKIITFSTYIITQRRWGK